jgi:hypothetical protein
MMESTSGSALSLMGVGVSSVAIVQLETEGPQGEIELFLV